MRPRPAERRPGSARLLTWLGILLSLVFALFAVRDVDLDELRAALRSQDYFYLLPAGAALAAGVALRAWRWQLLFERASRPPFRHVANALLIGYLFNTILPARAGELVRIQTLGSRTGSSRAHVLATVVLERSYDVVVLVALLALAVPFLPPIDWLPAALAVGGVLAAALVVAALAVRRFGERAARILLRPFAWLPAVGSERVERAALSLVTGLAAIRVGRIALVAVAVTAASWLTLAGSIWLLLLGTGIDDGFGAALLVLVATNLIQVIPSSPAALGAYEAAAIVALSAYGVDREPALSFALVLHALNALPFIPLGYGALALHARGMKERSRRATTRPAA